MSHKGNDIHSEQKAEFYEEHKPEGYGNMSGQEIVNLRRRLKKIGVKVPIRTKAINKILSKYQ